MTLRPATSSINAATPSWPHVLTNKTLSQSATTTNTRDTHHADVVLRDDQALQDSGGVAVGLERSGQRRCGTRCHANGRKGKLRARVNR